MTKEELSKSLKESVKWLWDNKCGCCHWNLLTDEKGREWSIVLGWNEGYEDSDNEHYFVDDGFAIATKIAYQESDCYMQTDMDLDFTMPYDEKTGDVCDTCSAVSRNEDYDKLAEYLLKSFNDVTKEWAFFEEDN